ncbi:Helix-turn-helix domain-containing protein [Mucilaginibacter gossypiicola]|uniref:Helix-turn-helix domain-containing protein n=1 Tax=Mucilaginibacter gossypiicola TaxID=551995 RepID=A0A1H8M5P3_9SPHI|nr:AraC family transcriptional regulator [Mucilaginibacter gossypiicola]SEO12580.1 Helix-turn-helix domain-containing protein [Mucilaginibacter gossypiicola]
MGLIASLPDIDKAPTSVYVLHEKLERLIPVHQHKKGQLSYVEGGIAYVHIKNKTLVIPARHYFWIPHGLEHILKVSHSATVLRSIFFYVYDDGRDPFYSKVGIYPISDLLLQMIKYTDTWEGPVHPEDSRYQFLTTIKNILPEMSTHVLPIALPSTENERMRTIMDYMEENIADPHTIQSVGDRFGLSRRSLSRQFQSILGISFLQYLKLLRMVKAFEMILQTDMTMSEVAFATGYQSLSSFSNTFYQFTKSRPSAFIKH